MLKFTGIASVVLIAAGIVALFDFLGKLNELLGELVFRECQQ